MVASNHGIAFVDYLLIIEIQPCVHPPLHAGRKLTLMLDKTSFLTEFRLLTFGLCFGVRGFLTVLLYSCTVCVVFMVNSTVDGTVQNHFAAGPAAEALVDRVEFTDCLVTTDWPRVLLAKHKTRLVQ